MDTVELLQALDGSNPAVTLVRTTVLGLHAHAGNGATTLCALVGLLTRVATDLQRMGHTTRWVVAALHAGASVCERTCEELAMPLQSLLPEALHTTRGLPTDGGACGYIEPGLSRRGISAGTERGGAAPAPPHASAATATSEGPEPADSDDEFDWYFKAQLAVPGPPASAPGLGCAAPAPAQLQPTTISAEPGPSRAAQAFALRLAHGREPEMGLAAAALQRALAPSSAPGAGQADGRAEFLRMPLKKAVPTVEALGVGTPHIIDALVLESTHSFATAVAGELLRGRCCIIPRSVDAPAHPSIEPSIYRSI